MIEKAPRIQGRDIDKYSFEFGNEDLKKEINKLDPKKDLKKVSDLESKFKYYAFEIQEPTFEQLVAANDALYGNDERVNLMKGGKVIWELCCVSFDPIIEKTPRMLMSICNKLATYALPMGLEIKKK